jgi:hypothetical protein
VQDGIQLEFDKIEGDVRMHCDNRNRFIVTADEKLTVFLELERVTCEASPRRSANKVDLPAPMEVITEGTPVEVKKHLALGDVTL